MKKKGITTWIRKKKVRYAAAGTLCLAAAIGILVLGLGIGSRAAENLTLGKLSVKFNTTTADGKTVYLVENADQMSKLGQASAEQTAGKTFRLNQDLDMEIAMAATGTFEGTFDGDEHVIRINHLEIKDSAKDTNKTGVSQGALFGTVSGTVESLVIDVTGGSASYQRTSDAGVEVDGTPTETRVEAKPAYDLNHEVSVFSTTDADVEAYQAIGFNDKEYTTVYLDSGRNEYTEKPKNVATTEYRKYISNASVKTTTSYKASNSDKTDSFGILCGTIGEGGTVEKVRLNGESVTVLQAGTEHAASTISTRETPWAFYYKVGAAEMVEAENIKITNGNNIAKLEIPAEESAITETASNQAVNSLLSMKVTAPKAVAAKRTDSSMTYTISYEIELKADEGAGTVSEAVLGTTLTGGTWSGTTNGNTVKDITESGTVVTYTYTAADNNLTPVSAAFTADVSDGTGQTVPVKAEVTTNIIDGSTTNTTDQPLKIQVSAPAGKLLNDDRVTTASTDFTVTLENISSRTLSNVTLIYESGMTVVDTDGGRNTSNRITFASLDAKDAKTITLSKNGTFESGSNTVEIKGTFSATASDNGMLVRMPERSVSTVVYKESKTKTYAEKKTAAFSPSVSMEVKAPEMAVYDENGAEITYNGTVKNENNYKDEKISVYDENDILIKEFTNIDAGATVYFTYKKTVSRPTDASGIMQYGQKFKVTAKGTNTSNIETTANTTIYGTAVSEGTAGSSSYTVDGLTVDVVAPQNVINKREKATIEYILHVTAPTGNEVQITAPTGGTWDGVIVTNGEGETGSTEIKKVIGDGTEKKITVSYPLSSITGATYETIFSVSMVDGTTTVKTAYSDLIVRTALTDGSDSSVTKQNDTLSGDQLKLNVTVPGKLVKGFDSTEVVYTITPTVALAEGGRTDLKLTASEAGYWGTTEEAAKAAESSETASKEYTGISDGTPIYFIRKLTTETSAKTLFTLSAKAGGKQYAASTQELETALVAEEKIYNELTLEDLYVKLEATPSVFMPGKGMKLTLTLINTSKDATPPTDANEDEEGEKKAHPIHISTDLSEQSGWKVTKGSWATGKSYQVNVQLDDTRLPVETEPFTKQILESGNTVVLERTLTSRPDDGIFSIEINGVNIYVGTTPTYLYMPDMKKKDGEESKPETTTEGTLTTAQNLSAGALAGINQGTIGEFRQDITLKAGQEKTDNTPNLLLGGVTGTNTGSVSDIYMTGSVQKTGDADSIITGDVTASGSGTVSQKVVRNSEESIDEPDANWPNWTHFSYFTETTGQEESFYDLRWLVKEDAVKLEKDSDRSVINLTFDAQQTGRELSYYTVYEARKQLTDKQYTAYSSETEELELENSGYYRPKSAYATDGYFQYVKNFAESDGSYKTYYPYDNDQKPVFVSETEGWSVVRDEETVTDRIQLTLHEHMSSNGLEFRYGTDGALTAEKENGAGRHIYFAFDENPTMITAVPIKNGRIYEEEMSDEYGLNNRNPLPQPIIFSSGYYDSTGKALEEEVVAGKSYEAGGTFRLEGKEAAGCSYKYVFTDSKEITDSASWDPVSEGTIHLPADTGEKYLHIKVTKDGFPETKYCLESITLTAGASVTAQMYYQYDANYPENNVIPADGKILPGDTLVLNFTQAAAMQKVQYIIKNKPEKALWGSKEWKDYDDHPITVTNDTGEAAYYVYVRMCGKEGNVYSSITQYEYVFGRVASYPYTSPRTVYNQPDSMSSVDAAAEIQSGTQISIGGQPDNGSIFYLTGSNTGSVNMEVSRVTKTEGLTDGLEKDSIFYYQIGERWYQIKATEPETVNGVSQKVAKYEAGTELKFYNDTDTTQTRYVGVIAIGADSSPSVMTTYIYKVTKSEQVSAPEASLATQYSPGGESEEIAMVEKGTFISFRSLTPGAEILYSIDSGTGTGTEIAEIADEDLPEGAPITHTYKYKSSEGIEVKGDYGATFQVRVRAVKWNKNHTIKEMKSSATLCFTYTIAPQKQALKPTATPATQENNPTVVTPGDKILLSTSTEGASIYYTVDGSSPEVKWSGASDNPTLEIGDNTLPYNAGQGIVMPEDGDGYFTIHAVAVANDYQNSPETIFIYAYPDAVQTPYANIPSGSVDLGTKVLLRNKTEGATIHYTVKTDGTEPADPTVSSSVFDEAQPIVINGKTVIKAFAIKNGVRSAIVTLTYTTKDQLAPPTASIDSGAMVSRGTRLKLKAASGATIYYTTDGSDPTDSSNSSVVSGTDLVLDGAAGSQVTVKAYAVMDGKSASEVATFTYQISKNMGGVTTDVATGSEVSNGSKVNLMTDVTGAEIYYTTDGSSPADSGIKGTVVTINGTAGSTFTIKAVAKVNGDAGTVCTFTYRIKERPSAPTASPSGGELTIARRVELSSSAEKIYYTTDGTTPTESSNLYKEPILINKTTTLQAIAVSKDGEISEVATFQYTAAARATKPEASYESGSTMDPGTVVTLRTDTANAQIYYSTDGTDPTLDNLSSLLKYTEEGIVISRTVTIKAVAYREDLQLSKVGTYQYLVDTIPAVEAKKAAEAQAEAEALHDTDASALARTDDFDETAYEERVLRETECDTVVSGTDASIEDNTVLVTKKEDCSDAAVRNVKKLFGEEYKILSSYDMYLMRGGSMVQPNGQVEIGIPIPAQYENAAVTIVYIDNNDKIIRQETRRKDGMAYAYIDHFSNYALVGLEDPGSGSFQIPWLLLLEILAGLCLLGGVGYFITKKVKSNR